MNRGPRCDASPCGQSPAGWYCRYGPSVNTRLKLEQDGEIWLFPRPLPDQTLDSLEE